MFLFYSLIPWLFLHLEPRSIYTIPWSADHGQVYQGDFTLQKQGRKTLWLYYDFALRTHKSLSLYNGLGQNLVFKPQNMAWGDSMPNIPPTQTSWLALESLCRCEDLCTKPLQHCLNRCNVSSALSGCMLNLLYQSFETTVSEMLPCIYSYVPFICVSLPSIVALMVKASSIQG